MLKPLQQLVQRNDVRLAVTAGFANALGSLSSVPFGYYAPLAVLAVCTGSYGGTLAMGRQRILGSLLGALVLLLSHGCLTALPMPVGIGIALGLQRLLGGALGLEVGYKVGGMVIIMGWLVHADQLGEWIPLRLFWTVVGILLAMLSLRLFWSQRILDHSWSGWADLLEQLAGELESQGTGTSAAATPAVRLRTRLTALRDQMPALRAELGSQPEHHPGYRLLLLLDGCCSRLIGLLDGLRRQQPHSRRQQDDALATLHAAETALLVTSAARLRLWAGCLRRRRPRLPPAPAGALTMPEAWRRSEALLSDIRLSTVPLERLERLAGRLQLLRQAEQALRGTEAQWQLAARR